MSARPPRKARPSLFRPIALARYRGPLEVDTPHILPPRRPGLVIAAAVIALSLAFLWM